LSDMSSPSPTRPSEKPHSFAVVLTVYSASKRKSKTSVKEEKSTKTKELAFPIDESNYVNFLQSILEKHGQGHFKVSQKKSFPFKFVPPKAKTQRASDAIDVDNEADYKEMVNKIHAACPGATKIFVNMKHIEKLPSVDDSIDENTSESSDNDDVQKVSSKDLGARLMRWRVKLERLYKNEDDEGMTYVGPRGPLPLTPNMILDWCRALEEGQATLNMPPNIESFNVAKNPMRNQAQGPPAPASGLPVTVPITPNVDINSLASVILLQTLTNLQSNMSTNLPAGTSNHHISLPRPATP
ncbi:hypothetical protein J3R83DRAFT_5769, partial [Lanmaoa asiatica]